MKWDLFKNKLKKEAQQQEGAVDIDALWSAIEPDVDALNGDKKKRRRFFFWFFFGTAVALTAGWFALSNEHVVADGMMAGNGELIEEGSTLSGDEELNNNLITNEGATKKEANFLTDDLNPVDVQSVSENQKEKMANKKNENENNASDLSKVEKVVNQKEIRNNSVNNTSINSNENTISLAKNANAISGTTTKNNSKANSVTKNQTDLNEAYLLSQTGNTTTSSEKETPNTNKEDTRIAILNKKTINRININSLLENWQNESLPTRGDSLSEAASFIASQDYMAGDKRKPKQSNISFTAGIIGGLSYANRNLSQKEGAESLIFQYRDQYESPMEATHYGFFIGANHKNSNLGITIGLQNTTITERYSYRNVNVTTETVMGIQARRINLDGDTINITGDILSTTTATINKNIHNSYRLLEIPMTLSYHFPFEKWNLGLEAGILANLSLKTKGIVPNELLEVPGAVNMRDQNIDNSKNDLFKTKIGLGYQFGLSFGGAIVGNVEWRVAPMLRVYPSDFAGANNELSQRYVLYGVTAGLAYRF